MKIIVTMIPTDLVTNLLLSFPCPFLEKQESSFQQAGGVVTRNIPFFCYKRIFLHVIFVRIIVPWVN